MSWLRPLNLILEADTVDIRKLAIIVGADPDTFYINQNLANCDLRGQDLSGMDLTGTNLSFATINEDTKIDPEFDPRFKFNGEYVEIVISDILRDLIIRFSEDLGYRYRAWAYKRAIDYGVAQIRARRENGYVDFILKSEFFSPLVIPYEISQPETIQVYRYQQETVHDFSLRLPQGIDAFAMVMVIGMVAWRIDDINKKDYSTIKPNSLFSKKRQVGLGFEM